MCPLQCDLSSATRSQHFTGRKKERKFVNGFLNSANVSHRIFQGHVELAPSYNLACGLISPLRSFVVLQISIQSKSKYWSRYENFEIRTHARRRIEIHLHDAPIHIDESCYHLRTIWDVIFIRPLTERKNMFLVPSRSFF